MNPFWTFLKRKTFSRAILLGLLMAITPTRSLADSDPVDCFDLFAKLDEQIGRPVNTPAYTEITSHLSSVTEVGQETGAHGGKRIRLKKTGAKWGSIYTTNQFDRQGDPRWFISLLGEKPAEFFGFKMLGEEEMLIPDYEEFSGALKKVNEALVAKGEKPVSISFYKTPDNHNVKVGAYVETFIKDHGIPIAPSGNHMIHDISYHTGAIFLPDHFLKEGAARTKFHRDFAEHMKAKYANDPVKSPAAIHYSYLFKFLDTAYIDTATARIGPTVAGFSNKLAQEGGKDLITKEMKNMVRHSVISLTRDLFDGTTPRLALEEHINLMIGKFLRPADFIDTNKTRRMLKDYPQEEVLNDLREFSKTYRAEGFPNFNPEKIQIPQFEDREAYLDRLCRELTEARTMILNVASDLAAKK